MDRLKMALRGAVLLAARWLGTTLIDQRTGLPLGRALVISYRGKVHVIGLHASVRPVFLPQERLTYWQQELGFSTHPPPDFPHEPRS